MRGCRVFEETEVVESVVPRGPWTVQSSTRTTPISSGTTTDISRKMEGRGRFSILVQLAQILLIKWPFVR